MKKISANYIFTGNSDPIKNGIIIMADNGVVLDVLNPAIIDINWDEVEQHKGIICPGFVNTHCHLELSYLKGKIKAHTQLHGFVKELVAIRNNFTHKEREEAIVLAEQEMINNGIVAVGDIANGNSTFGIKEKDKLKYHTFIEVFGSDPKIAQTAFNKAEILYNNYFNKKNISITPHATYSVSDNLAQLINSHCVKNNSLVTIHNQETASENEFFKYGNGKLFEFLNIAEKTNNQFKPTGKNALPSFLKKFKNLNKILLVHNTFTSEKDVDWAKKYLTDIYWCFCPNANLYIENTLPNFNLFVHKNCTIGTDSLASNSNLSILNEMKIIAENTPTISLQKIIKWATYNGAQFLGFNQLGSIEKGKMPGLNLLENVDLTHLKLKSDTKVKPLIKNS